MSGLRVRPGPVHGTASAPPSKSVTHRAVFIAFAAGGGSALSPLLSADTVATVQAVRALGAVVVPTRREIVLARDAVRPGAVDALNSGTTLRIATGVAALAAGTSRLWGDASLNKRPMGPLAEALAPLGATVRCHGDDGRPPLEVTGPLQGGRTRLPGDVSSQFVSSLLIAGTAAPLGVEVELTSPLSSRPYAELTVSMLRAAGAKAEASADFFASRPGYPGPVRVPVTGDYSSAAFLLGAAAATGGDVTVTNLPPGSGQADEAVLDHLRAFGARVSRDGDSVRVCGDALQGADIDLRDSPDLFPVLCALATTARGTTTLRGAPHLRFKESDRIAAMVDGLRALGGRIDPRDDGAVVHGQRITGGAAPTLEDHRIQMALAVAALAGAGPVELDGGAAYEVSFPGFPSVLASLGAPVEVIP